MRSLGPFLVEAKRRTYAAQGDDATVRPLLPGFHQLEYGDRSLLYRDVYVGGAFFVGQETVYADGAPCWSMSYAGGAGMDVVEQEAIQAIYAFLREALRNVSEQHAFRGPPVFERGLFRYASSAEGGLERFHGEEQISLDKRIVYTLHFGGGVLR